MAGEKERLPFMMWGKNRHQTPVQALFQDDGTIRGWAIQIGQDATGRERPVLVEPGRQLGSMNYGTTAADVAEEFLLEDDRTLRGQTVLWDPNAGPAAPIRWRGETGGEGAVSFYGEGAVSGNIESLVVNPIQVTETRDEQWVQVDPVEIPAADGILWNPGTTAADLYDVEFLIVNNDAGGAAVTVSIGVDIAAGGALAAPEYWLFNEIVPYPGTLGWRKGGIIAGDDDIRGVASVVNDASIHWRIKQVSV